MKTNMRLWLILFVVSSAVGLAVAECDMAYNILRCVGHGPNSTDPHSASKLVIATSLWTPTVPEIDSFTPNVTEVECEKQGIICPWPLLKTTSCPCVKEKERDRTVETRIVPEPSQVQEITTRATEATVGRDAPTMSTKWTSSVPETSTTPSLGDQNFHMSLNLTTEEDVLFGLGGLFLGTLGFKLWLAIKNRLKKCRLGNAVLEGIKVESTRNKRQSRPSRGRKQHCRGQSWEADTSNKDSSEDEGFKTAAETQL